MGLEVIVSEEAFVATYKDGLTDLANYRRAAELQEQGQDFTTISHAISKHINTVRRWLKRNKKPDSINGVERAKELGILPLTQDSEKLGPLARLAAWAFWSGCVSRNYGIILSEEKPILKMLRDYIKQNLGLHSTLKDHPSALRFNGNSTYYGRVLVAMGLPVGDRKSTHELHVPRAIMRCPETHLDFLGILFATRTEQTGNYWTINLLSNREEERAWQFGREMVDFMNRALPQLQLSCDQLTVFPRDIPSGYKEGRKNKVYEPRIVIYKDNIANLVKHYPHLVSVTPQPVSYAEVKAASTSQTSP
jgi:hypothetical protein